MITKTLALLLSATPVLLAQTGAPESVPDGPLLSAPAFQSRLAEWIERSGGNWYARADSATTHLEMLHGGSARAPFVPRGDAEWLALARHFVAETEPLHGISGGDLANGRVVLLPLGMGNGTDKVTVRLHQEHGGLSVENAALNVLFNTRGELLSVHSTAAPQLAAAATAPTLSGAAAARTATERFADTEGLQPTAVSVPELLFAQIERSGARRARLAWRVDATFGAGGMDERSFRYTIDAHTGALLRRENNIHHFDVGGQIFTNATPGTEADHGGNPPQMLPAGAVQVSSSAGTIFADRDGNFNFPGVNGPLDLTVRYISPWANVDNNSGADYTIAFNGVTGTGNSLLMNPSPNQIVTAQANGLRHVGIARDYIRDVNPGDATGDFTATTNVNINQNCNATYSGTAINFFTSGGGCSNTCFSTVVAHEYGHWLNVLYGTGNPSNGMGEGNADVYAMYVYDTPIVGEFFFNGGGFVRTGNNTRQFCGDTNQGCHGGFHNDGEVWMGAAWKIRRNLNTTLGDALGDATADLLHNGWMNAYNQSQITSLIEIQWLTLDDDDGDIDNGTPNYDDIDAGFQEQGFPGYDLTFVTFDDVTELDDTANEAGPYVVDADVIGTFNPIAFAEVLYSVNGGPFSAVPMSNVGGSTYRGLIPGILSPAEVRYYVRGTDASASTGTFPDDAPGDALAFFVGTITPFLTTEFEGPGDEGWTSGAAGDTATDGLWIRDDPVGTIAQPEDDHTPAPGVACWVTGQGAPGGATGLDDVDGGRTTLLSPVFDGAALSEPRLSYWRWFFAIADDDPFRVDLSNDGGASWTNVETILGGPESDGGWFQHTFRLADVLSLTASMRVRFVVSDDGAGGLVEAALDDIEGFSVTSSCAPPESYCATSPNSVGPGAGLLLIGSQSVGMNNASLLAFSAPTFEFGLFLYGPGQSTLPVGDGTLCIGLPFYRMPIVQTDLLGQAFQPIDFSPQPNPAATIQPGSTWNFQFWYRDAGGATGSNLSDALSIQFCE